LPYRFERRKFGLKAANIQNGHQPLCFFRLFVEFGCFREVMFSGQSIAA
jgi:hypothetical protein